MQPLSKQLSDMQHTDKKHLQSNLSQRHLSNQILSATQSLQMSGNVKNTPINKPQSNLRLQAKMDVILKSKSPDPSLNSNNLKTAPQ